MRIAVLGSGNVGKALASSFAPAGHDVIRGPLRGAHKGTA